MAASLMPVARWALRVAAVVLLTSPVLFAILILVSSVAGAPPEHAVRTPGATPIGYEVAYSTTYLNGSLVAGVAAPATSIDEFRCAAWRAGGQPGGCPDSAELAKTLWPNVKQAPDTLYVGLRASTCQTVPDHLNIEYQDGRLVLHCHVAAQWLYFARSTMGVAAQPAIALLTMPTGAMSHGKLTVVLENRVERWLFDQVTTVELGTVAI